MIFTTVDPTTGDALGRYSGDNDDDLQRKLDAARAAWREWRTTTVVDRALALAPLTSALRAQREPLAALATREMGKPIEQARAEVDKTASGTAWLLDAAPDALSPELRDPDESSTTVEHRPYGTVLGIMPWNFPYWQVLRSVVPALVSGNAYLLKPSPVTVGAGLAVRDLVGKCGLPDGLFDVVLTSADATRRLIGDDRIAAVTLTGSTHAGRVVAQSAGAALKPVALELGGSDPFVVLADADLDAAAESAVTARMQNNGQSCLAAKRFIVERDIASEFMDAVDDGIAGLTLGDPMDPRTDIGPLASQQALATLDDQVERSVAAGATRRVGAVPIRRPGSWYQPGSLGNVQSDQPAGNDELFGPVATTQVAMDAEDALWRATTSAFGLGAAVWTRDPTAARTFVNGFRAGTIAINQPTRSDPRYPFGGFGLSGHGRELSIEGLREFTAPVTVFADPDTPLPSSSSDHCKTPRPQTAECTS